MTNPRYPRQFIELEGGKFLASSPEGVYFHVHGEAHRLRWTDLETLLANDRIYRKQVMDELVRETEEYGGYDEGH